MHGARFVLLAPLLTFGPLFMTGMGGTMLNDPAWSLRVGIPLAGAFMTIFGLGLLVRIVGRQALRIEELTNELRRLTGK